MKRQLVKATLAAALGLGVSTAAHAQIASDDLILGFTSPNAASVGGSQYDYIIDLGQLIGTSAHQITLSGSQYDDPTFVTDLGAATTGGNTYAGIFGGKSGSSGDIIISATSTPPTGTKNNYQSAATFPTSVNLGAVAQLGNSIHDNISTAPGAQGANANNMALYVPSPLESISASQGTGQSLVTLEVYQANYTSIPSTASAFGDQGFVSILFNANGGVGGVAWDEAALAPVPEPGTYGLFGGLGVLLLTLRRKFAGRTA